MRGFITDAPVFLQQFPDCLKNPVELSCRCFISLFQSLESAESFRGLISPDHTNLGPDGSIGLIDLFLQFADIGSYSLLYIIEPLSLEYLAENHFLIVIAGLKKLLELPLRQHCNACELLVVYAQNLSYFSIDIGDLGYWRTAIHIEQRPCLLLLVAVDKIAVSIPPASFGRLLISQPALHFILLSGVFELKPDKCPVRRLGICAAQHLAVAGVSARLPEKGEADRIENRGLARPGLTGDEEDSCLAYFIEVNGLGSLVRAECRHGKFYWPHIVFLI